MDKTAVTNRQARYNYQILESLEAGIELKGTEVKSLRESKASLKDSFARVDEGELFLYNCYISPYEFGNIANVEPTRRRKLLVHRSQMARLAAQVSQKGMTLIPLKIYFKRGIAKVELAVAKGKLLYDKRETIRKRENARELRRTLKNH
ncbi:MAG: SsrA-binding protein SmpB [Candidatus Omnitrophica bacterium]|nr:SsrA-binding protein SmpB [Candidatus Omnitrophota bacterium]